MADYTATLGEIIDAHYIAENSGSQKTETIEAVTDAPLIPQSLTHQYPVETFTSSTWDDDIGSGNMSVNGMFSSTFSNGEDSVFGDGTDDIGLATGPEQLATNQTWGIALTINYVAENGFQDFTGVRSGNGQDVLAIFEDGNGVSGNIGAYLQDGNGNTLQVHTSSDYSGSLHTIVINKNGNSTADIDFYVDDMSSPVSKTTETDQAYDHTTVSMDYDMGFFSRNNQGTAEFPSEGDVGIFEFNSQPYSQTEREELIVRRPEV